MIIPVLTNNYQVVLFICTGNYYRSRYAELFFNARCATLAADWRAESRGLQLSPDNVGPIAQCVLDRLMARGLPLPPVTRFPIQLQEPDLARVTQIIALDEQEHSPLIAARFSQWADRITYWRVPDVNRMSSAQALDLIEREVERLIAAWSS
jgi:protein-tyrosine phosphatase